VAQNLNFNLSVDTNSAVSSINQFFGAFDQGAAKAKNQLNQAFGQTLQTNVQINLKDGELVAKKIQSAHQESKRLETAAKAINGQWGKTPNELKKQISMLKQIQGDTAKYSKNTNKVSSDWKVLSQRIREASNLLKGMTQGGPLQRMKSGLSGIIGKFTLVQTLANLATSAIMNFASSGAEFLAMAGRMETLQLQLEAFTGGAEQAQTAFKQFADIAANSPFNLEQVASAGKIMMAFGVETDQAVISTEQLAVAAAATGGDINLLARNLGQIAAQGQAYTRDLTQFAIQGIPIWEQMSQVTGKTVAELKDMARNGEISFDIVNQALTNLTASGTAFAQVAERMQETFAGRMARIEAAINQLALSFINTFNNMDRALGGLVSGSMRLFAEGIVAIANNLPQIAIGLTAATAAATAFFVVSNWGAILGGIKAVRTAIMTIVTAQNLANAATVVFNALTGNWAAIAAAVAVGGIAYVGLSKAVEGVTKEEAKLQEEMGKTKDATGELTTAEKERASAASQNLKDQVDGYDDLIEKQKELKGELDTEIAKLGEMKDAVKDRYDSQIEDIERVMDADRIRADEMKSAQDAEIDRVTERYDIAIAAIDAEIGKLREKTDEERALYEFQKDQLKAKIRSGELEGEALMRARARLSRMENQEEIEGLIVEKKGKQADKDKEIEEIQKRYADKLKDIEKKLDDQEQQIKDLTDARDSEVKKIQEAIDVASGMERAVDISTQAVNNQIQTVFNLRDSYSEVTTQIGIMEDAIRSALKAQNALNAAKAAKASSSSSSTTTTTTGPTPTTSNFAGGAIAAGTTSWVNELGKEAFLSASGRLSMINDTHGKWTAPSDGTIIPAHLTKRLDIPTGGINLNSSAASNSARAGSGGQGALIRAVRGAMSGNTYNQSVTVQSANPTQTANNMLVQMQRIKRGRYGR